MPSPPAWIEAERILGIRLDRRRTYRVSDGTVEQLFIGSRMCSGCSPTPEESGYDGHRGFGCTECGGHGRRIDRDFVPLGESGGPDFETYYASLAGDDDA